MSIDQATTQAPVDTTLTAWRGEPTAAEYFARNRQTAEFFAKPPHNGEEARAWCNGPGGQWCAAYTTQVFRNSGYSELVSKCPNTNMTDALIQNGINQGWGADTKDGQLPPIGSIVSMHGQNHTLSVIGWDEAHHKIIVADGNWGHQACTRTIDLSAIDHQYVSGAKMAHHLFTMGIAPTPLAAHESEIAKASAPAHFSNSRAALPVEPSEVQPASTPHPLPAPSQAPAHVETSKPHSSMAGLARVLEEIKAMREKHAAISMSDVSTPHQSFAPTAVSMHTARGSGASIA